MTMLRRKLARDLWHLRGQVAAISAVVACGVAVFVTTRGAYDSLLVSQARYYAAYRFADVFAGLKRAPQTLAARLATVPGVGMVQTRLVFDVALDVPGLAEPAAARLVSVPERRGPMLNDLYLRRGRWVLPAHRDEVLVGEAFAGANRLAVGDTIGAVLHGRWQRLRIVGVVLSPEYVYEIRPGEIFPDNRHFGVLWMSRAAMAPAFDMDGAFNDVAVSLAPGAVEAEVIARVDRLLEPYGGLGAYGRRDQLSHRFLSDEIAQNRVSGTVLPAIFLGVAAFLVNVVLSRLVSLQRDQIAVLKAFGYSGLRVGLHYLQFALVAVLLGAVPGTGLGMWLGAVVNRIYVQFYRFPTLRYDVGPPVLAVAVGVAAAAALLGAGSAVRRALALPPAEAMRAEPPPRFRAGVLERIGVMRRVPLLLRMVARQVARRPGRAGLSVLGVACAVAILVVGRYFIDAVGYLGDLQFRVVQCDDVTVTFHDPLSRRVQAELRRLPGVSLAEGFRAVPVRLRAAQRTRRVTLMGLAASGGLHRLVDRGLRLQPMPTDGVLLTTKLAEVLGVARGDALRVEVLEGERPVRQVRVAGTVDELIGMSAYMERRALHRLLRDGGAYSGAFLAADGAALPRLYTALKRAPAVAGVTMRTAARASFEDTLARSIGVFTTVLVVFACVIAVAMVYNAARIALSERGRELASLRVLGFTRREVALILLGEQGLLAAAALPAGFALGYAVCAVIARLYQWELFRLPLVVSGDTYAFALLVVAAAAAASAVLVRRRLDRLDLVEVLKARE